MCFFSFSGKSSSFVVNLNFSFYLVTLNVDSFLCQKNWPTPSNAQTSFETKK